MNETTRAWVHNAIRELNAEARRTADTNLLRFPLPTAWGVDLYVKDESSHPTGSLKHRLARSLILYGLVGGRIGPGTLLTEASSGSTAVSEAYFARLLGLPFTAVVPESTSADKLRLIESYGASCVKVPGAGDVYPEAQRIADEAGGYYLDQFGRATIATDWRGNNNIAASIYDQMAQERYPEPTWIVVGAGTGGTCATLARYARYNRLGTRIAVADPPGSVYEECWRTGSRSVAGAGSRIEGIGRPRVEPSFLPEVVDLVRTVPDAGSLAGMHLLHEKLGIAPGPSSGTNLALALDVVRQMVDAGESGSVVTLLCDRAERYTETYYNPAWVAAQGMEPGPWTGKLRELAGE